MPRWPTRLALLFVTLSACPAPKPPAAPKKPAPPPASAPAPKPTTARILFDDCEPRDAVVVVDNIERGTVDDLAKQSGLEVPFGVHRIVVKREGYESYRVELSVGETGERISIHLKRKRGRRP